ncbi:MAG: discoidin domain-containing protein [Candidatus Poribacteria bacterium]|nr:discoidin domain-containing protein [Candidatus Poribacteria bacterium]
MNIKYILLGGAAVLLGFLFYPREDAASDKNQRFIEPVRRLENEPLHYTDILRADPIVETFDLGFVYKIDRANIPFEDADESGPKRFDLLVDTVRTKERFERAFSYIGSSREYTSPLHSLSIPAEARWVQVVINDWFSNKPELRSDDFRVGVRYQSHNPLLEIDSDYNSVELNNLIDFLPYEASKWVGAQRIEKTVEDGENIWKEISFKSPSSAVVVTGSLREVQKIYGVRVTTDGPGNNVRRYRVLTSVDGRRYTEHYTSESLPDETVTDFQLFSPPVLARYVRMRIEHGDWYGDYPEIREFEVFADDYRPVRPVNRPLSDYNAVQMHHENLGFDENTFAPHLEQGFAFDRDTEDENRYFLPEGKEVDKVNLGNTLGQRSFAYHYDAVKIRYAELHPSLFYWVRVTYLQKNDGQRVQNLTVDGFILHDAIEIPRGTAESFTYAIPVNAYADGKIALSFNRLAGPNAVVSEVVLLEARETMDVSSAQLSNQSDETIGKSIRVSEKVVVDGKVSEWPTLYPMLPQNYKTSADSPISLYSQWDDDNLYVAAIFNQRIRNPLYSPIHDNAARDDSEALHLFTDTALNRSPGMYKDSDHHFVFTLLNTHESQPQVQSSQIHHHLDAIRHNIYDRKEIEANVSKSENGYTLEARIPKSLVLNGFEPDVDQSLGFNYVMANLKLTNHPAGWFSYGTSNLNAPPNRWNTVELVDRISGRIEFLGQKPPRPITNFNAGDRLVICIWDADRNTDRHQPESVLAELRNERTKQTLSVTLNEANPTLLLDENSDNDMARNRATFAAIVPTAYHEGEVKIEDAESSVFFVRGEDKVTVKYVDPYYSSTQRGYSVTNTATVNTGSTGTISIIKKSGELLEEISIGDTIYLRVQDADLVKQNNPCASEPRTVEVTLTVPKTEEIETAKLTHQPDSNSFIGTIETAYSETPRPNNGVVQAIGEQIVRASYVDGIQATGKTNVPVHAETSVKTGVTTRLELGSGRVNTGEEESNVLGNRKFFKAGHPLSIWLKDTDLNQNDQTREFVEVNLSSDLTADQRTLTLKETTENSGEFAELCPTRYAVHADPSNDILEVVGNAVVTLSYVDALQASGATDVVITDMMHVSAGVDGIIEIVKSNYLTNLSSFNAGSKLHFRLRDGDLFDDSVRIVLTGHNLSDREDVQLTPIPAGGDARYAAGGTLFGSIETAYDTEATVGDGKLQVQGTESVQAIYIDALRSTGETDIEVSDDCTAAIGTTGTLKVYNENNFGPDAADNVEIFGFRAGDTLILEMQDADINTATAAAQISESDFAENKIRDTVRVIMDEVTGRPGVFRGEVQTDYGTVSIPEDDILQVQGEGIVTCIYTDALQDTGAAQVPVSVALSVETGNTGDLEIIDAESGKILARTLFAGSFNAGAKLRIQLRDKDLDNSPAQVDAALVTASGNTDEVQLILWETSANSAAFDAFLQTRQAADSPDTNNADANSAADRTDDILHVKDKEVIRVVYTDEITATGETNVSIQAQAVVLSSSAGILRIVNRNAIERAPSQFGARHSVAAHELGNFNAGETIYFWLEDLFLSAVTGEDSIKVAVTGNKTNDKAEVVLKAIPETEGVFAASIPTRYGTTPVADSTLDVQGDEEIRAVYTSGIPFANAVAVEDRAYVNKGVRGRLMITRRDGTIIRYFNPGSPLHFQLEDADLNRDAFVVEATTIQVNAGAQTIILSLVEENANSHIFRGSVSTQYGKTEIDNGLKLVGGETLTATYTDALIDTGETNVGIYASCRANLISRAPYTSRPMLIDGLDDQWPLEKTLRTPQDEGFLWLLWGKDSLYVLAQIYDDAVDAPDPTKYYEDADALELHFDLHPGGGSKPTYLQTGTNPNRFILWICPKGAGFNGDQPYIGQWAPEQVYNYQARDLDVAVRQESNYYIIEARIPFFPVFRGFDPLKTKRNSRIGFNFVIHRSDDQAVYWASQIPGTEPTFPSNLGVLILESPP